MRTLAVTGGVACGKTHFCRSFLAYVKEGAASCFSSDEAVRQAWSDPDVLVELSRLATEFDLPPTMDGSVNRSAFRELLFDNSEFRLKVEGLLHPLVLRHMKEHIDALSGSVRILLVEVPLLYEVDFPIARDADLVVAASRDVQLRRLTVGRRLSKPLAMKILNSQFPIERKIAQADLVVWNDGDLSVLDEQTKQLAQRFLPPA